LSRIQQRILTNTTWSNTPVTIDTLAVYTYSYIGNSNTINSYSSLSNNIVIQHALVYDAQNRLLKDSITNPGATNNNKVASFTYLQDTVIMKERETFAVGTYNFIDTMVYSGNNVIKEKIKSNNFLSEFNYMFSASINPYSYPNNSSLMTSDYRNDNISAIFGIFNFPIVSNNQASFANLNTFINTSTSSIDNAIFTISLDSLGRVKSFRNSYDGNKKTSFEYN
jgi:hypothetical protein